MLICILGLLKIFFFDKHLRAVGQITSVDGVFIGPGYYYLMGLGYWLTSGNPASAMPIVTILGLLTVLSFYWVGNSLFSSKIGYILSFVYAVSLGTAFWDRWSVPTQPTLLWSIWFMYCLIGLSRGKIKAIPIYGVLVGLVWHIHIALIPIVPLPLIAFLLVKKTVKPDKFFWQKVMLGVGLFLIISLPLFYFEIKSNFSQAKSMMIATKKEIPGLPTGKEKFWKVINASAISIRGTWLFNLQINDLLLWILLGLIVGINFKLFKNKKEWVWLCVWVGLILLAQLTSKRPVSEYYFTAISPVFLLMAGVILEKFDKRILWMLGLGYLIYNAKELYKNDNRSDSYLYRRQVVEYIKKQVEEKKYPCISLNYIAKFGDGFGFRYLFWYNKIKVIKPDLKVANFDIANPASLSGEEINAQFGRFGVINSKKETIKLDPKLCNDPKMELDPMLGYVR